MEEKTTTTEEQQHRPIVDQVKEYLETYFKLAKLRAIEQGTSITAGIITDILIVLVVCIIFLFASIALALFMAEVFHSFWKGFGTVALFYLVVVFIILAFRKNVEKPIVNFLIRKLFK